MQKPTYNSQNPISSLTYYRCGSCTNQLGLVYQKRKPELREFPSGVFLIKHRKAGYILFDTGYSSALYSTGLKGWAYRRLNPTRLSPEEEIDRQLHKGGICPDDINFLLLSHLHPDHIGGLRFFPQARIVVSEGMMRAYRAKKFKDLIFTSMIPPWFEKQALVLSDQDLATEHSFRGESGGMTLPGYDLLGDRSLLIAALPGHAEGHLGALVAGSHLLAGDACWGKDLMTCSSSMRLIGRSIQHNYPAYRENLQNLEKLQDQGVTLCFSHDTYLNHHLIP
ncbi:MAG: MBL fold metallo-hydrolase [Rothia sp. (in: high G+C Gram-positive bacteria)]|nr:MBL fold metallo-hydrolase [Rothia sp. (in: high G+C Gram-positive bacteria)]